MKTATLASIRIRPLCSVHTAPADTLQGETQEKNATQVVKRGEK